MRINRIILRFELLCFASSYFCFIWYSFLIDLATYWIDVCQSNGNLLAASGSDENVKIVDKRESKIVQTFAGNHKSNVFLFNKSFLTSNCYYIGTIYCVRWSPSGDMLASSSSDKTVVLSDFKTGKKLYTGKTPDNSKFTLSDELIKAIPIFSLDFAASVCFIWERIKVNHPPEKKAATRRSNLGE